MAIETTLVWFGILPPIINTIPNSPTVWAKVRTIPVKIDFLMFGIRTFVIVWYLDFPKTKEA